MIDVAIVRTGLWTKGALAAAAAIAGLVVGHFI
jgi:hypothetical protein